MDRRIYICKKDELAGYGVNDSVLNNHVLVICTKDRPGSLREALRTVAAQTAVPNSVLIVDSSKTGESEVVTQEFRKYSGFSVTYLKSTPGLTFQRNKAIQNLQLGDSIVHFIDDDVILEADYFESILNCFDRHPTALGVGGAIQNLPAHKLTTFHRLTGLDSIYEGKVLKSGANILNFIGNSDRLVDWVSGCSMSFRRSVFDTIAFDERRKGNGIGEDVDFCLRVRRIGELYWTPEAKLLHIQSPINRENAMKVRLAAFRHYLLLASDGLGVVKRRHIYISELALSGVSVIKSLKRRQLNDIKGELSYWRSVFGK